MKKTYIGSPKLKCNFRMFRIKYNKPSEVEDIKSGVLDRMNDYLNTNDGKLINLKELKSTKEILVYFVVGQQRQEVDWFNYLKHSLLKGYDILPSGIELGPSAAYY